MDGLDMWTRKARAWAFTAVLLHVLVASLSKVLLARPPCLSTSMHVLFVLRFPSLIFSLSSPLMAPPTSSSLLPSHMTPPQAHLTAPGFILLSELRPEAT